MLGEEGATEAACDGSTIEATTTGSESSNLIIECRARPPHSITHTLLLSERSDLPGLS
jgi:hypothetical protein